MPSNNLLGVCERALSLFLLHAHTRTVANFRIRGKSPLNIHWFVIFGSWLAVALLSNIRDRKLLPFSLMVKHISAEKVIICRCKANTSCDSYMFHCGKQYVSFIVFICIVSSRWQQTLSILSVYAWCMRDRMHEFSVTACHSVSIVARVHVAAGCR